MGCGIVDANARLACMAGRTHQQSKTPGSCAEASGASLADSTALEKACSRILYWLDAEQLEKVRPSASIERIGAHSIIGPDDGNLRYLLTGAVRTSYTDQGCRRRLSNFLGPGDMVQNPFFCSPGTSRVFEAITDSSVLKIPVEPFADAVAGVP